MSETERRETAQRVLEVLGHYPNFKFGDKPGVTVPEIVELLKIYVPRKLIGDGAGWALCPNCETFVEDYHPAFNNMLDGTPQKHCDNCGQALIWEVEMWDEGDEG